MTNIEEIVNQAEDLRNGGKLTEAEELVRRTVDTHPDEPSLWTQLGHIHLAKSELSDAEAAFLKVAKLTPDVFWSWMHLGYAQKELGNLEDAIANTITAQTLSSTKQEEYLFSYNMACYLNLQGRRDEAMKYLRVAVEGDEVLWFWAQQDEDLISLHEDEEFIKLVLS